MGEHELQTVALPTLDETRLAELGRCGAPAPAHYRAGQILYRAGDRDPRFFVVKSGQVEISDPSGPEPKTLVVYGPGQFTGDVAHLIGGRTLVTAVARVDCELYEISKPALRQIINRCPDLGDVILQAFIARRQLLRASPNFAGLRVIGSRYSR